MYEPHRILSTKDKVNIELRKIEGARKQHVMACLQDPIGGYPADDDVMALRMLVFRLRDLANTVEDLWVEEKRKEEKKE